MTHDLVAPITGDDLGAEGGPAAMGPGRLDPASDAAVNSSPSAPPFSEGEADSIIGTIWGDLDRDPRRFDDLLTEAVGFIAGLALQPELGGVAVRAVEHLRAMEQRALWGPNHEQEDHR